MSDEPIEHRLMKAEMSKRKETIKRFSQLEEKIKLCMTLTREYHSALYRVIQLEDALEEYYIFLRTVCLDYPLSERLEARKKELEKIAEELGISDEVKAEETK